MDDDVLVERAAGGDRMAFELLVRRHTAAAWRLARLMLGDDFDADEAVQDTFVKAHGALDSFRGDSAVGTWLLAICRRTCLDRLRRKRLRVVPLDEARHRRAAQADAALRIHLEQAVDHLPADEREAFTLVDVLGYSREDAAGIVGCPPSTMRSRVTRARNRLADFLSDDVLAQGG